VKLSWAIHVDLKKQHRSLMEEKNCWLKKFFNVPSKYCLLSTVDRLGVGWRSNSLPLFFCQAFNFFGLILEFSKFVAAMQRSYTIALSLSFSEFLRSEAAFPSRVYKVEHLSVTELLTQTETICFVNKLLLFPNDARFVYYTVWHWN